jgi:hypothetical protein
VTSDQTPTKTSAGTHDLLLTPLDEGRFAPGSLLASRYRIVGMLGKGGMGEVYRADDLKLRQTVALKLLPRGLAGDPSRLARLVDEVRLARRVSHPNVCRVHDIGETEDGQAFLSMEYVDGENLASLLLRIGRLPRDKGLEVARQMCLGLWAAHDRGVVHRDLKPANVMIDGRGRVRLTDFGLAVAAGESNTGEVAGTPGYMAPEQLTGAPASEKTDIYALGLVLYEVVAGRSAFGGGSVSEVLRRQREDQPPPLSSLVPDIEPSVERVILRCLEKDPARRPSSALAVAAGLPGGDPLAVLVAAGETPPPEMVADAGGRGALRPIAAWSLLALVTATVPLGLWLAGRLTVLGHAGLDKPPEVLADRARGVMEELGHPAASGAEAFGFGYDPDALRAQRWRDSVRFWYRASPQPLIPRDPFARVSPVDPPPLSAGMATLWLDARGRLLSFLRVPGSRPALAGQPPEWGPLLRAAGLELDRLEPTEVRWPPPVGADALFAWKAPDPTAPEGWVGVEAASWKGEPVFFTLILGDPPVATAVTGATRLAVAAFGALNVVAVLAGVVFALRNWRRGRGDRAGALRLAAAAFGATLVSWTLRMSPLVTLDRTWRFVVAGAELALWNAAFVFVLYLAIEPFVRRRWPESLISWSRLLAGRFSDPRVGRDVLIGVTALAALSVVVSAAHVAPSLWGQDRIALTASDLGATMDLRAIFGWLADGIVRSLVFSLFVLVLLLLMRTLLRRLWLAALGAGLVFSLAILPAMMPAGGWTDRLGVAAVIVLLLALVARVGFLAMAVVGLFMDPTFPVTSALGAWYGRCTAAVVLLSALLAGYGFVVALGGRSPFGETDLDQ